MLLVLLAFVGGRVPDAHSAEDCAGEVARVVSVEGAVHLRNAHGETWRAIEPSAVLCAGDQVRVGARSRAALVLRNETTLRLDQNSTLTLRGGGLAGSSLLDLLSGALHVITRTPQPFKVKTPYVNAAVDGTEFLVDVSPDEARIAVYEGRVSASNEFGILSLIAGEIALVAKNQAPRKEIMVRPVDAVQWALYYPNIIDYRLDDVMRGSAAAPALRESIDLYRQGRLAEAIFRTDHAPEGRNDERFLTYRAGLLLMVGRVDEAKPEIQHALTVDPHFSPALALNSVIALVQNDKEQALALATKAVEFDPSSPAARMALSYAQQAHFKIAEATASVQETLELEPNSALAWARLAELQMSSGEVDAALSSARRAVQLDPGIAKTQSVLGFAHLSRFDTKAAKQAFGKAIELDQAEPLARLGLGLAKIREGDLVAGREEIEIALSLDPGNSLIRSYMGKAYYEEKRDKLAGGQFELAKRYDPRDPTPWFYDAIRKQTENRPVEALQDLEKSIELNDNRAVTRSRLMLDQDKATVGAGLAEVYNSLGFEQLARSLAYGELENDPSNAALHQFLANSYSGLPLLDVARASEALLAKLYQPAGALFSEPLLGESRLFMLKPAGISSFFRSDAARLLERPTVDVMLDAIGGSHNTSGTGLAIHATNGRLGASVSSADIRSDGFRPEEPFKNSIARVLVQSAFSPDTNTQFEWIRSYIDRGEVIGAFDPDSVLPLSDQERLDRYRLGFNHSFSPRLGLLVSGASETGRFKQSGLGLTFEDTDTRVTSLETQAVVASDRARFVLGAGSLTGHTNSKATDLVPDPLSSTRSQRNAYLYAYPKLANGKMNLSLGLSWDWSTFNQRATTSANPKLGFIWKPSSQATLRFGALKSMQREFIGSQTIEPTQVVGITQFLFGVEQTKWWHYGGGGDFHLGPDAFVGFDAVKRYGQYPSGESSRNFQLSDFRAYGSFFLPSRVAIAADYFFEEYREPAAEGEALLGRTLLRTHLFPLTLSWQAVPRTTVQIRATGVRQTGILQAIGGPQFRPLRSFWLVDLNMEHRLPGRYGSVRFAVRNVLDRRFEFEEPDVRNPILAASRLVLVSIKLQFP